MTTRTAGPPSVAINGPVPVARVVLTRDEGCTFADHEGPHPKKGDAVVRFTDQPSGFYANVCFVCAQKSTDPLVRRLAS